MSLLTVDEFIKSGKFPLIRNRNDVYMLIRMGGLKTVKRGKRRYIVDGSLNEEIISNLERIKEKRNRKIRIEIPEIVYKLIYVIADREKKSIEELIEDLLKQVDTMLSYFSSSEKSNEIEVSQGVINELSSKLLNLTTRINNLNKNKRVNGKRITNQLATFILIFTLYSQIKFK